MNFRYQCFQDIPIKGHYSHHLFLDVVRDGGLTDIFAIIVRGNDQFIFPAARANIVWNTRTGDANEYTLATGTLAECEAVRAALVKLYTAGEPYGLSELPATPGALECYAILSPFFGVPDFRQGNRSGRRVGNYKRVNSAERGGVKAAQVDIPDEVLAALINDQV